MAADVEFLLDDGAPAGDEELPESRRSRWPRLAVALAVLAVAGLLVARVVVGHGHPASKPSLPTGDTLYEVGPAIDPYQIVPAHFFDAKPQYCPEADDGAAACSTSRTLPAQARAAIRGYFPGAQVVSALDERVRDVGFGPGGIWYRHAVVRAGTLTVTLEVRPTRPGDVARQSVRAGRVHLAIYAEQVVDDATVLVEVNGPANQATPLQLVASFANDARLR